MSMSKNKKASSVSELIFTLGRQKALYAVVLSIFLLKIHRAIIITNVQKAMSWSKRQQYLASQLYVFVNFN